LAKTGVGALKSCRSGEEMSGKTREAIVVGGLIGLLAIGIVFF
jgi:hypothetical protein